MQKLSLAHLSDAALDQGLESAARDAAVATAWLLAHIAESDARRRYAPAGYPSMFDYCVRHLGFSEDAAYRHIRVARAARRFPAILSLIAAGRFHLTGALLLAPQLTTDNARELIEAATGRTKSEIELLLAGRFPRPDLPERIVPVFPAIPAVAGALGNDSQLAPEPVGMTMPVHSQEAGSIAAPQVESFAEQSRAPMPVASLPQDSRARIVEPPAPQTRVFPLAPERFAIQCTVSRGTYDQLRRAQELLQDQVPGGDLSEVLGRALQLLVRELERRHSAATGRPRTTRRGANTSPNPRHIPAAVRRAVWERDRGQCTFVGERGRQCGTRGHLELDHIEPVARGGRATVGNLRLRCRTHNQLDAERTYGTEFMTHKRPAPRSMPAEGRLE